MRKTVTQEDFKRCLFVKKYGLTRGEIFNEENNELINILRYQTYFVNVLSLTDNQNYTFNYADKIEYKNILFCFDDNKHTCYLVKINNNIYKENDTYHLAITLKKNEHQHHIESLHFSAKEIKSFLNYQAKYQSQFEFDKFQKCIEKYMLEDTINSNLIKEKKIKL